MSKNILIYSDEGVTAKCKRATLKTITELFSGIYQIKLVDQHYVNNHSWEPNTVLFIMPGGYSKPHYKNLAATGSQKIINFVQAGGKYLGLCAGAYYGCAKTEFEIGTPLEVRLEGPLNFFKGIAYGAAYGIGKYVYGSERGARAALVNWPGDPNKTIYIYFNGGCYFIGAEHDANVDVLSRFLDLTEQPPAILRCKVGKGIAILSGVHFEFEPQLIDQKTLFDPTVFETLMDAENQRRAFFKIIMKYLALATG